jgi:hypothetical protein
MSDIGRSLAFITETLKINKNENRILNFIYIYLKEKNAFYKKAIEYYMPLHSYLSFLSFL